MFIVNSSNIHVIISRWQDEDRKHNPVQRQEETLEEDQAEAVDYDWEIPWSAFAYLDLPNYWCPQKSIFHYEFSLTQ